MLHDNSLPSGLSIDPFVLAYISAVLSDARTGCVWVNEGVSVMLNEKNFSEYWILDSSFLW